CDYLQSHLDAVLNVFNGGEIGDGNTIPGGTIRWDVTDPAAGCTKDPATVTATNYGETAVRTANGGTAVPETTSHTGNNGGGCVFIGGNQSNINCNNNSQNQAVHSVISWKFPSKSDSSTLLLPYSGVPSQGYGIR